MAESRRWGTLVLGGSGFLGAHVLAAALAASDRRARETGEAAEDVMCAGRTEPVRPRQSSSEHAGDPRSAARARWHPLDALHAGAARELCLRLEPARVVVCTALSTIPECEAYPGLARALNVDLPREVARSCSESGVKLVLVSTDLVFGAHPPPAGGFDESASAAPLSSYGRTKAQGEEAALAAHADALVVRLPLLFGDSGGRGLGASDRVLRAVERGERPAMFVDEWRTPLDVACAARALIELADRAERGILHVAGPECVSRHELALRALVASGLSRSDAEAKIASTTRAAAGMAARPEDVSLDASRARALLRTRLDGPSEGSMRAAFERRTRGMR